MRIFIAAEIPEYIRSILSDYISDLSRDIKGVKWEKPEKIHLTLRFLGELDQEIVDSISASIPKYIKKDKIDLQLNGAGAFPGFRKPRILFIGMKENGKLKQLKSSIDRCLMDIGFDPEEREFVPHLTIGRVKKPSSIPRDLPEIEPARFRIENVIIFRSKLDNRGSVHIPLTNFKLE